MTWLTLTVTTSGQWRVLWYAQEKGPDGNFRPAGVGVLAEGLTGDPELLSGRWVTLAGRSSGDRFEVWVNGRSVARGRVAAAFGEGSDPGGWGATIAATPVAPGAARLEVDYVAVWHLPPDPSR